MWQGSRNNAKALPMNRRTLVLLSTVCAAPAIADAPQAGQAAFDGGRGQFTFETGYVEMSVEPVKGDAYIAIDGTPVTFADGIDRVDGRHYGGTLSYVLPGEDEPSWFGRNLRVFGGYGHQKANAAETSFAQGPTIFNAFDFTGVSKDGRAFASSLNHAADSSAQLGLFTPAPTIGLACVDTSGANTSSGFHDNGFGDILDCDADANGALSQLIVTQNGANWLGAASAVQTLGDPVDMQKRVKSTYSVVTRRGEAGFAGDHQISPAITLTPSVSAAIGERRAHFITSEIIANDFDDPLIGANRVVNGRMHGQDAALNLSLRARYAAGGGFDIFGAVGGAVVRRKTEMAEYGVSAAVTPNGGTAVVVLVDGAAAYLQTDTITAYQGTLEFGAGYTVDPSIGIGPLRLSLTGGLTYDSDVPTYGNVGAFSGPLTAPVAAAHIAYSDETTMTLKGAITLELP